MKSNISFIVNAENDPELKIRKLCFSINKGAESKVVPFN